MRLSAGLLSRLIIFLVVFLRVFAGAPAAADWYDPQGKTNYGSDYYTAAENSFQELWPTLTFGAVTGTSWAYDAQNRVNTFSLCWWTDRWLARRSDWGRRRSGGGYRRRTDRRNNCRWGRRRN